MYIMYFLFLLFLLFLILRLLNVTYCQYWIAHRLKVYIISLISFYLDFLEKMSQLLQKDSILRICRWRYNGFTYFAVQGSLP